MNRSWCFTENNPTGLIDWSLNDSLERVRYAVYQHEVGENGTPHFQGYVEFNKPVRLSYCRTLIPGAHWETRKGTRDQARNYAMKEETRMDGPYEYGDWTGGGQGQRTDVQALKALIDDGASLVQIWDEQPTMFLRYLRSIQTAQMLKCPQRTWKTEVHVLYGPTNTGKTRFVMDNYGPTSRLYFKQKSIWWDGYIGQENVILDDFYGWLPYDELLRLLDRYPLTVQTKGSQTQFLAKRIFLTSNTHPIKWYSNAKILGQIDSFIRRVDYWYWVPATDEWHRYSSWTDFLNNPNV